MSLKGKITSCFQLKDVIEAINSGRELNDYWYFEFLKINVPLAIFFMSPRISQLGASYVFHDFLFIAGQV